MPASLSTDSFLISSARRIAWLALSCVALGVNAQALDSTSVTRLDPETVVLPVWSNASGRVEALLLLESADAASSSSALDRVLNSAIPDLGIGARVRLDNGSQVRAALGVDADAGLALLCDGRVGITGALGAVGEHCLLATLGQTDPLLANASSGATLGLGWTSPEQVVDLSFGLSWLRITPDPLTRIEGIDRGAMAHALLLGQAQGDGFAAWARQLESRGLRLDSLINLGPQTRMLIGGGVSRSELLAIDGTPLQWDSTALSVGLGIGDFSGQLTGRLIELPRVGSQWSTLDIGVSWRTPWRGELSVGARNVLGGTDSSRWPLAELPAIEDPGARVPYVRYQQDL
jgi:hypothetical protein